MRLWTLHPRYLDAQGLVALWREALLARAVLRGETRGYRHHPQLLRFREHPTPRGAINAYLAAVLAEADARGYAFDRRKVGPVRGAVRLDATTGQLDLEWRHLMDKLRARSPDAHRRWRGERRPDAHPIFRVVEGGVAPWERARGEPGDDGDGARRAPAGDGPSYPVTPDGRYFVVRGRLWRRSDPALAADERERQVAALMRARRDVARARTTGDDELRARARHRVDAAKRALGERGAVWWTDGAPDYNRRLARNTPYADWAARLTSEARAAGASSPSHPHEDTA
jgi:hypothetical protein